MSLDMSKHYTIYKWMQEGTPNLIIILLLLFRESELIDLIPQVKSVFTWSIWNRRVLFIVILE